MTNEGFSWAVVNKTLVIGSQFTTPNIHRVIKLVSIFVRTNNPNASVG